MNSSHDQAIVLNSSVLAAMTYSREATLELIFRSGAIYRYVAVPPRVVGGLIAATSKGEYFNRQVRNHFRYQRLT